MDAKEQVAFLLDSMVWNGDGYGWQPKDWDYRITPSEVLRLEADKRKRVPHDELDRQYAQLDPEMRDTFERLAAKLNADMKEWRQEKAEDVEDWW